MLPTKFNPKLSFFLLKMFIFFQKADLHGEGKISVDDYFEILTANNIKQVLELQSVKFKAGEIYVKGAQA